jgi:Cu(I)/Ag(I) efflux system membrane fusion protein
MAGATSEKRRNSMDDVAPMPELHKTTHHGWLPVLGLLALGAGLGAGGVVLFLQRERPQTEVAQAPPPPLAASSPTAIVSAAPASAENDATAAPAAADELVTRKVRRIALYRSPMDPTQTSPVPRKDGMGMDYVPVYKEVTIREKAPRAATPPHAPALPRAVAFYRSPMDPRQTSPVPRKDEMGMDYLPVYRDELTGNVVAVAGRSTVTIDVARQQLIGLRTALVTRGDVGGSWRTVGRVEVDPTRVRKTNVKVEGYVQRIYVNFTGQSVRKGQPLFTLYSPTLLAAQNDYVITLEHKNPALDLGAAQSAALLAAARRRLLLWDVPEAAIAELERTHQPSETITFNSPIAGVVTQKNVVEGSFLNAGDSPYEVTDLSTVWVMVDVYESDISRVKLGMAASLSLPAAADRVFRGEVRFIEPMLDPTTRTVKVHLHFPNPTGELKPALYGEVTLSGTTRSGLRVPLDAVIRSGTKAVVFLALDRGEFRPVEVQLGERTSDQIEVVSGLSEGQSVVTRANFLVDSESQLRASLADLARK